MTLIVCFGLLFLSIGIVGFVVINYLGERYE